MPKDMKQLRNLLGWLSYYRKFPPQNGQTHVADCCSPEKNPVLDFTPEMKDIVRDLLTYLASPPALVFFDLDGVEN